jgi:hypothetical protein
MSAQTMRAAAVKANGGITKTGIGMHPEQFSNEQMHDLQPYGGSNDGPTQAL